jgi:hypothetical protein
MLRQHAHFEQASSQLKRVAEHNMSVHTSNVLNAAVMYLNVRVCAVSNKNLC